MWTGRFVPAVAGAALTATAGVIGAAKSWSPEVVAVGAVLGGVITTWMAEKEVVKDVASGVATAAAAQLAMTIIDRRKVQTVIVADATPTSKRPSNAGEMSPESVREALERVRTRMAMQREMEEDQMAT